MIALDIEPSLCSGQTAPQRLEDGFSPPQPPQQADLNAGQTPEAQLSVKSEF